MFKTILCAIDGSAASERLLLYVMHFGKTESAILHLVHAYQLPDHYAANEGYEQLIEAYLQVAQHVVQDARSYMREYDYDVTGEAIEGAPAEVILAEAQRVDADLIMMGMRNPADVSDLLLGSVSQRVLNNARIPVLLIP
ncbi:MAG: universal stress protein [Caldilineales bacterium]|nr:universal stress protein [Caldilineales bacterium]